MADTGPDQTVSLCDTVQLDGSGSEDPFLGEIVSYRWGAPAEIFLQQADEVIGTVVDSDALSGPEGDGGGDGNDG